MEIRKPPPGFRGGSGILGCLARHRLEAFAGAGGDTPALVSNAVGEQRAGRV